MEVLANGDADARFEVWGDGASTAVASSLKFSIDWAKLVVPMGFGHGYGETQNDRLATGEATGNGPPTWIWFPNPRFKIADKGFGVYTPSATVHAVSSNTACVSQDYFFDYPFNIAHPRITSLSANRARPGQTLAGVRVDGEGLLLPPPFAGGQAQTAVTSARLVQVDGSTPVAGATVTFTGMSGGSALLNMSLAPEAPLGSYLLALTVMGTQITTTFTIDEVTPLVTGVQINGQTTNSLILVTRGTITVI
jgi:hypothetical protein